MSNDDTDQNEYRVGYGKPPRSGQFRKGQSGNPSGKRKKGPHADNLFQQAMLDKVPVMDNGKTVMITRKHHGVRKRVEDAAKGKMHALREIIKLRAADDPVERSEEVMVFTLDEARAGEPLEYSLNDPKTVIHRQAKPVDPSAPATATPVAAARRARRRAHSEPRSQSFRALIDFELARKVRVSDPASGRTESLTLREIIMKQLANAFANGRSGAMALAVRLNEQSARKPPDRRFHVSVPWDYVIPPKPTMSWPERRALGPHWRDPSGETS